MAAAVCVGGALTLQQGLGLVQNGCWGVHDGKSEGMSPSRCDVFFFRFICLCIFLKMEFKRRIQVLQLSLIFNIILYFCKREFGFFCLLARVLHTPVCVSDAAAVRLCLHLLVSCSSPSRLSSRFLCCFPCIRHVARQQEHVYVYVQVWPAAWDSVYVTVHDYFENLWRNDAVCHISFHIIDSDLKSDAFVCKFL